MLSTSLFDKRILSGYYWILFVSRVNICNHMACVLGHLWSSSITIICSKKCGFSLQVCNHLLSAYFLAFSDIHVSACALNNNQILLVLSVELCVRKLSTWATTTNLWTFPQKKNIFNIFDNLLQWGLVILFEMYIYTYTIFMLLWFYYYWDFFYKKRNKK